MMRRKLAQAPVLLPEVESEGRALRWPPSQVPRGPLGIAGQHIASIRRRRSHLGSGDSIPSAPCRNQHPVARQWSAPLPNASRAQTDFKWFWRQPTGEKWFGELWEGFGEVDRGYRR